MKKNNLAVQSKVLILCAVLGLITSSFVIFRTDSDINNGKNEIEDEKTNAVSSKTDDPDCSLKRDIAIILGDRNEYLRFHNRYMRTEDKDCEMQRQMFLYSFIMAEIYQDKTAAGTFCSIVINNGIEVDSNLSKTLIKYLELTTTLGVDSAAFLAAKRLHKVYRDGLWGISVDKQKAKYYDGLSGLISAYNDDFGMLEDEESGTSMSKTDDSDVSLKRDIAIILGDRREYLLFHTGYMYTENKDCEIQRQMLLYSFIMAEKYQDKIAASFFSNFITNDDFDVDSNLSKTLIKYLELTTTLAPDAAAFFAATTLQKAYRYGLWGISVDKKKAKFYDDLCGWIIKFMH